VKPHEVTGFKNYTDQLIYDLRGLFGLEIIDSRPVKYENVAIWLDAKQRIHRQGYPAIERSDGSIEFWEHGTRK
jgi:hypothetical protein